MNVRVYLSHLWKEMYMYMCDTVASSKCQSIFLAGPLPGPIDTEPDPQPPVFSLQYIPLYQANAAYISGLTALSSFIRNILLVVVYLFLVILLFDTIRIACLLKDERSYPSSCIHNGLIYMVTLTLRLSTRFLFPFLLCATFHFVIKKRAAHMYDVDPVMEELEKPENQQFLRKVVHTFIDFDSVETSSRGILQRLFQSYSTDLSVMCISSILEGMSLSLILTGLGAHHYSKDIFAGSNGLKLLAVFDTIACLVLNSFCGMMLAFFFFELKLIYLFQSILKSSNGNSCDENPTARPTKELQRKAKIALDHLSSSWCIIDIFMNIGAGLVAILLITSAASGLPLSCGVRVNPDQLESDAQIQWLWFVIFTLFSRLLANSVFAIPLMRPVGVTLEILGVAFVFCTYENRAAYSQYLQILYAISPACYCFWYHSFRIVNELKFIYYSTGPKTLHIRHLATSSSLLCLLSLSVAVSIYTEYTSLAPVNSHKVQWEFDGGGFPVTFMRYKEGGNELEYCMCSGPSAKSVCTCFSPTSQSS